VSYLDHPPWTNRPPGRFRSPLFWTALALGILGLYGLATTFVPLPDPREFKNPTDSDGAALALALNPYADMTSEVKRP
jgi:hypothetical protein